MKIQVTKTEIKNLVFSAYNLPPDTCVEIVDDPLSLGDAAIKQIEAMGFAHDNFVARVKKFREITGAGLVDSKYIIENWVPFKEYHAKHNKIPMGRLWNL